MIHYRGMTFCSYIECEKDCPRKVTGEINESAQKEGLPLSLFSKKPDCYQRSPHTEKKKVK